MLLLPTANVFRVKCHITACQAEDVLMKVFRNLKPAKTKA